MKRFLVGIIIALAALAGWIQYTATRPTELHREIIAGLKADLSEAETKAAEWEREVSILTTENRELKRRNELSDASPGSPAGGSVADSTWSESGASGASGDATSHGDRIAQIEAIYTLHRDPLEKRSRELSGEIAGMKRRKEQVADTTLTFSEQSTMTDADGNFVGNRGVRTSQADRDQARRKLDEKVKEIGNSIIALEGELATVERELTTLRTNYTRALSREQSSPGAK